MPMLQPLHVAPTHVHLRSKGFAVWFKCDIQYTSLSRSSCVLQLPLEWATTSHQNAYNYATTSSGMLQKYQGPLIQIRKTTASYKAQYIDINCGFGLRY